MLQLTVLDASRAEASSEQVHEGLKGDPTRALLLPSTAARAIAALQPLKGLLGPAAPAPEGTGEAGPSCFRRGFWILKALIAQHLIWRLKTAMETHNYLKYVFSSFLGREEEKPVSKKLLQVHNSPSEPRSLFHLSSWSDRSLAPSSMQILWSSLWKTLTQSRHPIPYPDKSRRAPEKLRSHVNALGAVPPAATHLGH